MLIAIISWVLVGLAIGFVATKLVDLRGDEPLISIGVAVIGAFVAGFVYRWLATSAEDGWSPLSIAAAAAGAVVAVGIYHLIRSKTISRDVQTVRRSY